MSPFLWDDMPEGIPVQGLPLGSYETQVVHEPCYSKTVFVHDEADLIDQERLREDPPWIPTMQESIDMYQTTFPLADLPVIDQGEVELRLAASGELDEIAKPGPVVNKRPREGIQLCQVYKPAKPPKWDLVCFEPKRNGNRCRTEIRNCKAALLSSTGLPHWNVEHIITELELAARIDPIRCSDIMLDGELMHDSLDFDTASGMLRNHTADPRASGFYLHLWDAMPVMDFDARKCALTLKTRKELLEETLSSIQRATPDGHVKMNPYFFGPVGEALEYAKKFVIEMGEEGIVLKNAAALYACSVNGSKAPSWLKWKPKFLEDGLIQNMLDGDMTITGAVEGRGKNKGMMGALQIEGYLCDDGNIAPVRDANSVLGGQHITSEVGTGPSNAQRKEMWKWHLEGTLAGRVVEIRYENVTKNGSLHHPVFYRLRPDKE